MKFIGITGGVGAGKSAILDYLSQMDGVEVMLADEIAHQLMEPGTKCYMQLKDEFSQEDIFQENGSFDRLKLATVIFSDEEKRDRLNSIVHPAVKEFVVNKYNQEKEAGRLRLLVLEAALLIEEHYNEICDELWYIYTEENTRRARLKASRGYSDSKIDNIFASQMKENEFRANCDKVIDNNGELQDSLSQLDMALETLK